MLSVSIMRTPLQAVIVVHMPVICIHVSDPWGDAEDDHARSCILTLSLSLNPDLP